MAADLITAQDMIDRLSGGAEALRRFAGDDGTGSYDADKVALAIAAASEEGYEHLLGGFGSNERVQALAANDARVKVALVLIARFHLTVMRDDFRLPDGRSVFEPDARASRDVLRAKSDGDKRTSAEKTVNGPGESELLRPRGSHRLRSVITDCGTPRGF